METKIVSFIGHIIDLFGFLIILYMILRQTSDTYIDIFIEILFVFCTLLNHLIKYILYENIYKKEEHQHEKNK